MREATAVGRMDGDWWSGSQAACFPVFLGRKSFYRVLCLCRKEAESNRLAVDTFQGPLTRAENVASREDTAGKPYGADKKFSGILKIAT
jgi:hypothetical protein